MSTILEALRKLQREKQAVSPPRDLRGSVTDEFGAARGRRRGRGGVATFALVLVACLALAGGAGFWLYRSGKLTLPHLGGAGPRAVAQAAAPAAQPEEEGQGASEAELEAAEREADAATAADPELEPPVTANPTPPPAEPPTPQAEAEAERTRLQAAQQQALAALQAQQAAEAAAQQQAAAQQGAAQAAAAAPPPLPTPAPAAAPVQTAQAAPPAQPAPQAKPAAVPKPKAAAAPKRAAKPKAKPVVPEIQPDVVADTTPDAADPFPPVRVTSIRWHPLSARRLVNLRFEQQNVNDAHEGDVVGGVLVYRIDPGAVELRVGSTSRVVRPIP